MQSVYTVEDMLGEKNYSKCPLKKRPVHYSHFEDALPVSKLCANVKSESLKAQDSEPEQPQNLSLKKTSSCPRDKLSSDDALINVSDCCEDEGVDVDHTDDDDMDLDEDEEMIECVDIEENNDDATNTTQAAALAAASGAVIVPKPTYPKYGLQPWNFHLSPYTAEFYRTINNPHLAQQISQLRGELLSPSSPSDSIGSMSPPPHYLHGRASSVSPPVRSEIIPCPIGVRQLPQSPQHTHRFLPYRLPAVYPHHQTPAYPSLAGFHHHHAPISPAYSDSSYYSIRSRTPESNCSSAPEDLSLKHTALPKSSKVVTKDGSEKAHFNGSSNTNNTLSLNASSTNSSSSSKKDKSAPPRYQCPDCQKSYSTFSGLTKHQQFHCPAAEGNQVKKSFSCKDCDKTYVSLGALKMHIRTHTLPCKCNICGKAFSRPWLLQGHIRTHTGEKPFSCQHCHRAFADRSNLRAHLQTHSDIKKYSCTNCSKTFSRMSLLTKHSEGGCPGGNAAGSCSSSEGYGSATSELSSYPVYVEN